jgi:transcriptional pleiotropic repressor
MAEKSLLDKVREVNKNFLDDSHGLDVDRMVNSLGRVIDAGIYVLDLEENILGRRPAEQGNCERLEEYIKVNDSIPGYYNLASFQVVNEPQVNVAYRLENCPLAKGKKTGCIAGALFVTAIPILGDGQRTGTLLLLRGERPFDHDDIILAEIGAAITGLLFMRLELDLKQENARNKALAEVAFESLSYSEVEAMDEILKNLTGDESIIVASKIADDLGITRSVIVNAMRKLESAGIIESRSLGMKGTYVRVHNPLVLKEIASRSSKIKLDSKSNR